MLKLKVKPKEWVEIIHMRTKERMRFQVVGQDIAFDDPAFHFAINGPKRQAKPKDDHATDPT